MPAELELSGQNLAIVSVQLYIWKFCHGWPFIYAKYHRSFLMFQNLITQYDPVLLRQTSVCNSDVRIFEI